MVASRPAWRPNRHRIVKDAPRLNQTRLSAAGCGAIGGTLSGEHGGGREAAASVDAHYTSSVGLGKSLAMHNGAASIVSGRCSASAVALTTLDRVPRMARQCSHARASFAARA